MLRFALRVARASCRAAVLRGVVLAIGVFGATAVQAQVYAVRIQGERVGAMSVNRGADGAVQVRYEYKNNGRGPEMDETFTVDAAQVPVSYRVRGKATYGGEIREDFTLSAGRLRWTSLVDEGDEAAAPETVFAPIDSTPAYLGQMARALLARPQAQAPSLGGTVLRIERLLQMQAAAGNGSTAPVALYAITGGDTAPWLLWLHDDGSQRLFGMVFAGWHLVPEGFEGSADGLLERQLRAQTERLQLIQRRSSQPLDGLTRIRNVRWFDAPAARMRGPADIYLFRGQVSAITAPGAWHLPVQRQIEGQGRTLLPGLIDMHAHLGPEGGIAHLAAGVTTVRDMANQNDRLEQLMQRIDAGELPGPHVVPAGFIEGRSPFSSRNGIVAATLDEALAAVDQYAARGYRQIKLYNSMKPEWVKPVAQRAHALGLTVAGHVPAFMRAEEAVRAGFDELTHINQMMLNFFVKPTDDTRTLLRFTLVGDKTREVPQPAMQRFIRMLKQHGTAVDATLATFEGMYTQKNGQMHVGWRDIAGHLPVLWRRSLMAAEMGPTEQQIQRYRQSWARMTRFVGELHRAGVTLVSGTDDAPGLSLHRELLLYVQCGIAPAEVLKIATFNSARVAGVGDRAGRIAQGRPADLVLVDGDPSVRMEDIRRVSLVIQARGHASIAYAPAALYEAQGIRPFVDAATVEKTAP